MIHKTIRLSEQGAGVLTTYVLNGEEKRPAVLVLPGGAYFFTSVKESEPIALKFAEQGFHAFVLDYSVSPHRHPQPLLDASEAMCIIREHAEEWKVDPDKIAVCGFSAGGHLAASLGVFWREEYLKADGKNKPNALILAYPVITADERYANKGSFDFLLGEDATQEQRQTLSLETMVNEATPPTFLWHTVEDEAVPVENSLLFSMALQENKIPFEMHIYPNGGHGLSTATEETGESFPHVATWMDLCMEWLKGLFQQ